MAKKQEIYKRLDADTKREMANYVVDRLRVEEETAAKERYNKKRANVKLLLRNYRSLADHSKRAIFDAQTAEENNLDFVDVLKMMSNGNRLRIDSIRESAVQTRLMVEHVDNMLQVFRNYCDKSGKPEDSRRYRVIQLLYLSPKGMTAEEIAACENVDVSTIYRDIGASVEWLTALIFGVDGLMIK